jgi:cytohesin
MEVVAVLLGANASLTAVTAKGRTALYLASSSGHTQVVQLLLANGADPFTPDGDGSLPLHVACRGNHMKTAARLLRGRRTPAHLNAPDGSSHTPLHLASKLGHAQMVALLLKAGADVDARTDTQRTPLHLAVRNGHTQVLEQLLAAGADPAALFESEGLANGLHVAALYNQPATLEVLLPAITAATGRGVVDVKYQGMTPLHWAVEKGHASCVKVLLEAGADLGEVYGAEAVSLEGVSLEGMSVLHRAVQLQYAAMVPLLATPRSMCCLWQGMTPLHWAVEKGHTSCVEALLAAGADPGEVCGEEAVSPDGVSLEGMSVLHRAVQLHNAAYVPLLATPRSMCCMWEGQTPLHCALRLGKPGLEMAQALVAARSPAGVVGGDGTTAMSLAGSSLVTAIRALLPGMVRNECWRYKRLQQGNEGQQQQQGVGQQQEPAAVLAAVVEGVSLLVRITTATGVEARTEPVAHCFQVVLDVLGGAVGGNLLQQVLNRLQRPPPTASSTSQHNHAVTLTLYRILHGRWLAELRPLIQMRGRVALRLQGLVTQPPQLPAQRQSRQQMLSNACSLPPATAQLKAQASAAAAAGKWPLFVQLLEQLEGLHSYSAYFVRSKVAHALVDGRALQPEGLCEALLGAWEAAQQDVASRTKRELADAVVGAVRVWQLRQKPRQQQPQQQVVAVEGGKRQRTGKARGR